MDVPKSKKKVEKMPQKILTEKKVRIIIRLSKFERNGRARER